MLWFANCKHFSRDIKVKSTRTRLSVSLSALITLVAFIFTVIRWMQLEERQEKYTGVSRAVQWWEWRQSKDRDCQHEIHRQVKIRYGRHNSFNSIWARHNTTCLLTWHSSCALITVLFIDKHQTILESNI